MIRNDSLVIWISSFLAATSFSALPARGQDAFGPLQAKTIVQDHLSAQTLRDVKVGGEIGRRIDLTVQKNLLAIDLDKTFLNYIPKKTAPVDSYIGTGNVIQTVVWFSVITGDAKLLAMKKRMIDMILKAQEPDGYIGLQPPPDRLWAWWDMQEVTGIVQALLTDYLYYGDKECLDASRRAMDWIIKRWESDGDANKKLCRGGCCWELCTINFETACLRVYHATGDTKYLDFVVRHRKLADWNLPIVLGRKEPFQGHVVAFLDHCLSQLELYRLQPQEKLLAQSRRAMRFLTREDGLMVNGATGQNECWNNTQQGAGELGETCATLWELWFWDNLMRREGDSSYGDLMERAIYNALFAAQSVDGRRIRYFSALEGPRVYWERDDFCCPCTYRCAVACLPTFVYYTSDKGIAVNLYTPSSTTVKLPQSSGGLSIELQQKTDYPNSGKVQLSVNPSQAAEFDVNLRIPRWCAQPTINVNGQPVAGPIARGEFFKIHRQWKPGDQVELNLPMAWRLIQGRKEQVGRVAVMRGPLLFCLSRSRNPGFEKVDLKQIKLDPTSLAEPVADATIRPDGIACRIRAWGPKSNAPAAPDLNLLLTEFPDPAAEATYFLTSKPDTAVADELCTP